MTNHLKSVSAHITDVEGSTIAGFLQNAKEKLSAAIPVDASRLYIRLGTIDEYYAAIEVNYYRPETESERTTREGYDTLRERSERATYEALKKKYGEI